MKSISPKFPVRFDSSFGDYAPNVTSPEVIKQNFKNLMLTCPGERVMDVNFGVGMRNYFFEPMTQATYTKISDRVRAQTKQYMPFVSIKEVHFQGGKGGEDNLLGVSITYIIGSLQLEQRVQIQSTPQNYL
jgi:phage baseplate assembly protein W